MSAGRGALLISQTRPTTPAKDGLSVVPLKIGRPPYAFEEKKQSENSVEDDEREVVISKCCNAFFPVSFITWTLVDIA